MAEHPDRNAGSIAGDAPADRRVAVAPGDTDPSGPPTQGGGLDHAPGRLLPLLAAVGLEPTSTELADILWLAARLRLPNQPSREARTATDETARHTETLGEQEQDGKAAEARSRPDPDDGARVSPSAKLYPAGAAVANGRPAIAFRAPAAPALANALEFYRALRPLHRRVPSHSRRLLDEDTTAERIAEQRLSGHRFWAPSWNPAREPWFELALVIDRGATMAVWRETLGDLHRLFDTSGAFRRTRLWRLETDGPEPRLYAGAEAQGARLANHEWLTVGPERRLVLVASDCIGAAWHTGTVNRWLALWGAAAPVALLQLLPQRLWDSTALGRGRPVRLRSRRPGALTSELEPIGDPSLWLRAPSAGPARGPSSAAEYPDLRLPVLTLEPPALLGWGRLLGGIPDAWCGGVQFGPDTDYAREIRPAESGPEPDQAEVLARLADFRATASPLARRLASLLAAAPLTLPVMRLVQRIRLPESGQGHLAEILVSGLLRRHPDLDDGSDQPFYDFHGDCRELLLDGLGEREARGVLDAISGYVADRTGGVLDFSALLVAPNVSAFGLPTARIGDANSRHFASIGARVLRRFGMQYQRLADLLTNIGDWPRHSRRVSPGTALEAEYSAKRDQLLKNLEEGIEVTGVVKNLTDDGAFVDLGGIDGLLHITDMAWRRVKHPSEVVEIGQEIKVKVLKIDRERRRVSLGLKQMSEDPWLNISDRYPERTRVCGKVTSIADHGCFVEIEEGVEGLVHVSEMDRTNENIHPSEVVNLGDAVDAMVLDIDEERRRISLTMDRSQWDLEYWELNPQDTVIW